jgi:hypothetical protein
MIGTPSVIGAGDAIELEGALQQDVWTGPPRQSGILRIQWTGATGWTSQSFVSSPFTIY